MRRHSAISILSDLHFELRIPNTTRHAMSFGWIEPEIAFSDLQDDMDLAESMLKYVINYVLENAPEEMCSFSIHLLTKD